MQFQSDEEQELRHIRHGVACGAMKKFKLLVFNLNEFSE